MIRVWFNHWFSTSYRLIELMKADANKKIYIIGSNMQKNSVIQKVCDEWHEEPTCEGAEYISYCLDFCKSRQVDVFVPRRNMLSISQNIDKFNDIGVKVLLDDYETVSLLEDKVKTYDFFKSIDGINVPDYYKVASVEEFKEAYAKLSLGNEVVCAKFVRDEGGKSFRKIIKESKGLNKIKSYAGVGISYDDYLAVLEGVEDFGDIILMPYLEGNEISVDCINTKKGLIAIPREKGNSRDERIFYDEDILNMVGIITANIDIKYPFNVQFKYKGSKLYLLEINTRMSGGLQMSCLAADINIPGIALNKLLGEEVDWVQRKKEAVVSYVELPYIIRLEEK